MWWCDLAELHYGQAFVTYKVLPVYYPVHLPWISVSVFGLQQVLNFTIRGIFPKKYLVAAGAKQADNMFILPHTLNFSWTMNL